MPGKARAKTEAAVLSRLLLAWYDREGRDLPWRRTRDPYAVWVSEVMLQQTRVATVLEYYTRWMRRFPDLAALARAGEADVLQVWQGLGYYSRARRLLEGARRVVGSKAGRLPGSARELGELPGIGTYTAGAIASIAFDERVPVVDGNVVRVLTRLFALRGDPARMPLSRTIFERATELVPGRRPGDHNQALMELGATLCAPRKPDCERCPLARHCAGRASGIAEELPELAKKLAPTRVRMAAALVEARGRFALVRVPEAAPRWAGLWQFPNAELRRGESADRAARRAAREQIGWDVAVEREFGVVQHSVTRYLVTLEAFRCRKTLERERALVVRDGGAGARLVWKSPSELEELAMPAAHRRLARKLAAEGVERSAHGAVAANDADGGARGEAGSGAARTRARMR